MSLPGMCSTQWGTCLARSNAEGGVRAHKCTVFAHAPGDHEHSCKYCPETRPA